MVGLWAAIMAINIVSFCLMGVDKSRAKKHQYRIRERTLWLAALFGGAVGATVGMYFFRHKTKHLQFKIGFPILAIIDVILYIKGVF
ncbi:DUF1294 domain-containing protein [Neobacillus rhizophilus]|uniref:DUF1294 domain-containing protein n=1 Tax=Neobacillus rhizophilus TaxID=2833579 RepID=A0A942UDQ9_9BACI|nr:DUF1294 domain-containing protein [Neobacillus rhizophilus]MBS4215409.1 DUF1294 domain-containing protein [Neobacillus rhizophilus]